MGSGSRLTYRVDKSEYHLQKMPALILLLAGLGAVAMTIAPLAPVLMGLVPLSIVLCLVAWFFVVARLRNSGPEEFFEDLAREAEGE
jgi:hypothetical protein